MKPTEVPPTDGGSRVAVCIASRRRPDQLQRLLQSLERAREELGDAWAVRAYVVDNDPAGSAMGLAPHLPSWVRLFHEPREGIPYARNRTLEEGLPWADWIAFVDDDELVDARWLKRGLEYALASDASVVAGPIVPEFEVDPPPWVREVGLIARPRHATGHRLSVARTGNLLVQADVLLDFDRHFDTHFAHTGGSDTEFTERISARYSIHWCDEAVVYEFVPQHRMTLPWHVRRSLRIGANRIDRADVARRIPARLIPRAGYVAGSLAEAILGGALAVSGIVRGYPVAVAGALRIVRAAGTIARALGIQIHEYSPLSDGTPHCDVTTHVDFVVGCGRSGTTLLRAMLDAHPDIAVPGETHFIPWFLDRYRANYPLSGRELAAAIEDISTNERIIRWQLDHDRLKEHLAELTAPTAVELVGAAFDLYAETHAARHCIDKTPEYVRSIETLAQAFPTSRFVHMLRDPRDTAASLVEASWGPTEYASALRFWKKRVLAGRRAGQELGPDRYLEVHYEHLVAEPTSVLQDLCAFLDIPFDPSMTSYWQQDTVAGQDARVPSDHENISRPPRIVRDWRQSLPERKQVLADLLLGDVIEEFGYELSGFHPGPTDYAYAIARWLLSWSSDLLRWVRTYRPRGRR